MVEPYQWLYAHANECGFKSAHIGPASVDLSLGALSFVTKEDVRPVADMDGTFPLFPEFFYLASTEEYIRVPVTHCAFVQMRSSWARRGLGHKMAGFVDPGFEGQITLELETAHILRIPKGERIVQIIYQRLTEPTERPYVGKYNGQVGPTPAYKPS